MIEYIKSANKTKAEHLLGETIQLSKEIVNRLEEIKGKITALESKDQQVFGRAK